MMFQIRHYDPLRLRDKDMATGWAMKTKQSYDGTVLQAQRQFA